MLEYATTDDLDNWLPADLKPVTDAESYLRSASILVARAVNESLYAQTTTTSDPKRDATCAQVQAWLRANVKPDSGGISTDKVVRAKTIADARLEYDTALSSSAAVLAARAQLANALCAESEAILRSAGVLYVDIPVWSDSPDQGQYVSELGVVGGHGGFTRLTSL